MAYRIIPRSEWGARRTPGPRKRALPARRAYLHHSGGAGHWLPATATFEQECAVVRAIEEIGHQRFGAYGYGISYTGLVFPSGRIYEGHPIEYLGAHTSGHNTEGVGVNWPGDYTRVAGTPEQIAATKWLLEEWHRRGHLLVTTFNGGHRDVFPTACPGDTAYAQIPTINRADPGGSNTWAPGWILDRQRFLNRIGITDDDGRPLDVDDILGPRTEQAVRRYQLWVGIKVDGKPGDQTASTEEATMKTLQQMSDALDRIDGNTSEVGTIHTRVKKQGGQLDRLERRDHVSAEDVATEVWSHPLYGFAAHYWLRDGAIGDPEHRNFPADPGSRADAFYQGIAAAGQPVTPHLDVEITPDIRAKIDARYPVHTEETAR